VFEKRILVKYCVSGQELEVVLVIKTK